MTPSVLVFEIKNTYFSICYVHACTVVFLTDKNHWETCRTLELSCFVKALRSNMFAYLGHITKANLKGRRISRVFGRVNDINDINEAIHSFSSYGES